MPGVHGWRRRRLAAATPCGKNPCGKNPCGKDQRRENQRRTDLSSMITLSRYAALPTLRREQAGAGD
jgi:hypothetical protein